MRWYFSLPGPVAGAAPIKSGPVVFTLRFSSGLTPKISGAATLMNCSAFANNELRFSPIQCIFMHFSPAPSRELLTLKILRPNPPGGGGYDLTLRLRTESHKRPSALGPICQHR